jgi:hypothetical protein
MNDSLAFVVFVAVFGGGLVAITVGMAWIVIRLVQKNRRHDM